MNIPLSGNGNPSLVDNATQLDAGEGVTFAQFNSTVNPEQNPDEVRRHIDELYRMTGEYSDFKDAVAQHGKDLETIFGKKVDVEDPDTVTVNHVYRNAVQTVATVLPTDYGFKFTGVDKRWAELAQVAAEVATKRLDHIRAPGIIRGWVQDATHFRAAILKCSYKRTSTAGPMTDVNLGDQSDNQAEIARILQDIQLGYVDSTHPDRARLIDLLVKDGSEIETYRGMVLESIPLNRFRIDPKITSPEMFYDAEWMRHDCLRSREEIVRQKPEWAEKILATASRYDEIGRKLADRTEDRRETDAGHTIHLHLVSEIWDRSTGTVYTLVEGVSEYLAKWTPTKQWRNWFPFVCCIHNRAPDRFYGISDTELQAKLQHRINVKRTQEMEAQQAAQPRFAYDAGRMEAEEAIKISTSKPWSAVPLMLNGTDIRTLIMALSSTHEFNPQEYSTAGEELDLRKMAVLPEQALGQTGTANFAAEVSVAQSGLNVAVQYRKNLVKESLKFLYTLVLDTLLLEETPESVTELLGREAAWPSLYTKQEAAAELAKVKEQAAKEAIMMVITGMAPPESIEDVVKSKYAELKVQVFGPIGEPLTREVIYNRIGITIDPNTDSGVEIDKRIRAIHKAVEMAPMLGVSLEGTHIYKLVGKLLGEPDLFDMAANPELNSLITRALEAAMANPQGLAPETLNLIMAAIPQLMALMPAPTPTPAEGSGVDNQQTQGNM